MYKTRETNMREEKDRDQDCEWEAMKVRICGKDGEGMGEGVGGRVSLSKAPGEESW